jgi:hypothetical protein
MKTRKRSIREGSFHTREAGLVLYIARKHLDSIKSSIRICENDIYSNDEARKELNNKLRELLIREKELEEALAFADKATR